MRRLLLWSFAAMSLIMAGAALAARHEPIARWLLQWKTPELRVPEGWPRPVYDARDNPITRAGFELGRKLFYDPQLSIDGSVSCASCHQQFAAFAHYDHALSHGLGGVNGTRNAPALFNLAWQRSFMWDGAVTHLELQPLAPLSNPVEMGETLPRVLEKLRADAAYAPLFEAAFGTPTIDSQHFLRALAQFLSTLISDQSRYDRVIAGKESFNAEQARGFEVYRARCASCHAEPLFTDGAFHRDGIVSDDPGRSAISGDAQDRGRMRTPSLRNLANSGPYMHDGRFDTLEQVLAHYAHGIRDARSQDALLEPASELKDEEIDDLLAFLATLNDEKFLDDPRFAEPR